VALDQSLACGIDIRRATTKLPFFIDSDNDAASASPLLPKPLKITCSSAYTTRKTKDQVRRRPLILLLNGPRGLRGRKYSYCECAAAAHFSDLFRYVELLCASKDRKTGLAATPSRYGYFYHADPMFV
jgi:hypothetical protein